LHSCFADAGEFMVYTNLKNDPVFDIANYA
jgi:hypothetical protein